MPAPFDFAAIVLIKHGFLNPNSMPPKLTRSWYIAPWAWTNHDDAKDKILECFDISEDGWHTKPDTTIEWSLAVCCAGYSTEDIPFDFGADVTIAIVDLEMVYS